MIMKKTSQNISTYTIIFLLFPFLLQPSCKKGDTPDPNSSTFSAVVSAGGIIENKPVHEKVDTVPAANPQQVVNDDIWVCKDFEVDISQNADDFVLYSSNSAEIIYPGNLLQGKSVSEGKPAIIPLKRGPGTITINTLNGSSVVTETVPEVSFSSIAQATNNLIGSNNGDLTANISYTREDVRSLTEVGVKMNANFSTLTTKVKGSFDFNGSYEYSSVFVKVTQSLYSIVLDIPDVDKAFDPSVTPEDLKKYVYEGNPATYISSVNYGRIFYLLIQSTQSSTDIKAAINASFNGAVVSASGSVDVKYVNDLANVKVSGYAYGGDANLAAGALIGGMDDVKTFIEKGGSINNGAPISYVVRSLEDPSVVVAANLTTKYTVSECENVTGGLPVFTNTRQSIGAACHLRSVSGANMVLFDGASNEYVVLSKSGNIAGPFGIWQWGPDNTHPFRNSGVGAALNTRFWNPANQTIFFNKAGTHYAAYRHDTGKIVGTWPLSQWGPPFSAIGAAMDASIGTREIACLFNLEGTEYTLAESGQFTTPRPISELQIRDRDEPLAIPFSSVGAALRLDVAGGRNVMAIFDGEGKKYVYFDLDRNVIVGPLDI